MSHDCGTGCGRPTTSHLCGHCARELEDALATLGSWTKAPEPLNAWCDLATRDVHANYGRQKSSVFDIGSGHNAAGGTKGLAADVDPQRARQSRRGNMNGPRLAPDSKVWVPQKGLDRIERQLALAVVHWIALLHGVNVSAPRAVTTGHVLARGCTWLLWHVRDITSHPDAAKAHAVFTRAAESVEKLIDLPPDRVYVGPCWKVRDVPVDGPPGVFGPMLYVQCQADLYADLTEKVVTCREFDCGHVVDIEVRKAWLSKNVEDELATRDECLRAVAMLGLEVSVETFKSWVRRGQVPAHSYIVTGGRKAGLYRVGDVIAWASRLPDEKRGGSRKVPA